MSHSVIKIYKGHSSAQHRKHSLMKRERESVSQQSKIRTKPSHQTLALEERITNFRRQQHRRSSSCMRQMRHQCSQRLNSWSISKRITLKSDMRAVQTCHKTQPLTTRHCIRIISSNLLPRRTKLVFRLPQIANKSWLRLISILVRLRYAPVIILMCQWQRPSSITLATSHRKMRQTCLTRQAPWNTRVWMYTMEAPRHTPDSTISPQTLIHHSSGCSLNSSENEWMIWIFLYVSV